MKPSQEEISTLFYEGRELIKNPKTYVKGVHKLNKAYHKGSCLACYVLAKEMLKEQKLYPADPERSDMFFKKAFPFLEMINKEDKSYYLTRHYLASYYYHGYAEIGIDEEMYLFLETDAADNGNVEACQSLVEYYSKDASRDLDKVEHYKEILESNHEEVPVIIEEEKVIVDEEEAEATETPIEEVVTEEEVIVPLPEKGNEPEVDATQFFKFDENDEQDADITAVDSDSVSEDKNWESTVATSVAPLYTTIKLTEDETAINETKLAKALDIFEKDRKEEYEEGFKLFKEVESVYPVQVNCYLGDLYLEGKHTDKNELTAIHYYQEAERNDSAYAAYKLGLIYLYSSEEKTYSDKETGLKYIRQAGLLGLPEALFELGEIYYKGKTGVINKVSARKFYQLALDRGYIKAKAALIDMDDED